MYKKINAKKAFLIYSGASSLFFTLVFTVSSVYYIQNINMSPLQLVLVGTALETSCFLFEIPTGIVADAYSRRLSLIIGLLLIGAGFLLEGIISTYLAVMAAQVLWGVGSTFLSGADNAWAADEMGEEKLEGVLLASAKVSQLCSLIGIILSTLLANISVRLPIAAGGALFFLLAVFLSLFMPEEHFKPADNENKNSWHKMFHTFIKGIEAVKKRKMLKLMLIISLFYGLYSEGFDRLWTAHFIKDTVIPDIPGLQQVTWFGIINGCAMVFTMIAVGYAEKKAKAGERKKGASVLLIINAVYAASILLFGLSNNFALALFIYWSCYVLRRVIEPLYNAWANSYIESEVRATVLSTIGQMDAMGQVLGGPVLGIIAEKISISWGIIAAGIILIPVIFLYYTAGRVIKKYN